MRAVIVACLVASAGIARAQAPGETPPVAPAIAERWALGLSLASESLKPSSGDTAVGFGVIEAALRYRVGWRLELAASLAAGGDKTDVKLGALFFDARYRFVPDHPWNWYVLAGLGLASVAGQNASDGDKRARIGFHGGAGVEWRPSRFALEAELRLIAIARNGDAIDAREPAPDFEMAHYQLGGASLSLGASYYF